MPASTTRGASVSPPATGSARRCSTRPRCIPISSAPCMPCSATTWWRCGSCRRCSARCPACSWPTPPAGWCRARRGRGRLRAGALRAGHLLRRPGAEVGARRAVRVRGLALVAVLDARPAARHPGWVALGPRDGVPGADARERARAGTRGGRLGLGARGRPSPAERATAAALVIAGTLLGLSPVAIRNYAVGGGLYLTTSQLGPNFYIGNNPHGGRHLSAAALRTGRGRVRAPGRHRDRRARGGRRLNPNEVSRYWMGRALDFIASDPAAWLRLMARKTALFVNRERDAGHRGPGGACRMVAGRWPSCSPSDPLRHPVAAGRPGRLGHVARTAPVLDPVGDGRHLRREHHRVLRVRAVPVSAGARS